MKTTASGLAGLVLLALLGARAPLAFAQDTAPTAPTGAPAHTVPPVAPPRAEPAAFAKYDAPADVRLSAPRYYDAHVDRLLLLSTAETQPAGTFYVSDHDIFIGQLGYALTDSTQITLTGAPPLGPDGIVPLDLTLKSSILRGPTVSVALLASASGVYGVDEVNGVIGRAGGAVTFCQPAWRCRLGLTFTSNLALSGRASVVFSGAGGVYRFTEGFALVFEAITAVPLGPVIGELNGVALGAGVRFSGEQYGVDLGLFGAGKPDEPRTALVPVIVFSWRTAPQAYTLEDTR